MIPAKPDAILAHFGVPAIPIDETRTAIILDAQRILVFERGEILNTEEAAELLQFAERKFVRERSIIASLDKVAPAKRELSQEDHDAVKPARDKRDPTKNARGEEIAVEDWTKK